MLFGIFYDMNATAVRDSSCSFTESHKTNFTIEFESMMYYLYYVRSRYGRRERPHLVFDGASPVALTSAVTMPPTREVGHPKQLNRWPDASFTFLQPIKMPKTQNNNH
eukprot:COSAG06_NODE_16341_length_1006_cov_1.190739_1_plen_108_part_00